ncbi:MAG TPA: Fic family protein [Gammaproteobacteria bacterium]|jgi:Fic family protein|nr:Fic family protein [Gammaproteobacteria bacterium]
MAKPFHELLAASLARAEKASKDGIVRTENLSRRDRERLLKGGWLEPIIAGWYLLASPRVKEGESTVWFASFWNFIQQYLEEKFQENYCLSAESSLDIHTADNIIPQQVVIIVKENINYTLTMPYQKSMLIYQDIAKFPKVIDVKNKLQVMPIDLALCRTSKLFFQKQSINAKIALSMIRDPSEITRHLLESGMIQSAGRLAGAYRFIHRTNFTTAIIETMKLAGFQVTESNPFNEPTSTADAIYRHRIISPYYARIMNMWETMRTQVIAHFPKTKMRKLSFSNLIKSIDSNYVNDAYHSLSIEGYQVSKALIEKIKLGKWNLSENELDLQHRNALAAKGYYLSFLAIKNSIKKVFDGDHVIDVLQNDLSKWYQALFLPSVEAGLISVETLAGYRNDRVYIRYSQHVPPPKEAILDCMDAFFECLQNEKNPIVRAVLGHFIFVFIHPYMDGNGRIGRFMMNLLWCTSGYPWTIVRVESRKQYLQALESASVDKNIVPLTLFLSDEMKESLENRG